MSIVFFISNIWKLQFTTCAYAASCCHSNMMSLLTVVFYIALSNIIFPIIKLKKKPFSNIFLVNNWAFSGLNNETNCSPIKIVKIGRQCTRKQWWGVTSHKYLDNQSLGRDSYCIRLQYCNSRHTNMKSNTALNLINQ